MRPVSVKELLASGERLGITGIAGPADSAKPVRRVFPYPPEPQGQGRGALPRRAVLVFSSAALAGGFREKQGGCPPEASCAVSCIALPTGTIPPFFQDYAERTQTAVFASRFDEWLIHSRLTGLLLEMGRQRVMVHGTLVRLFGRGVLLMGESGVGKTATALAAMAGENRWVADDAVVLEARAGLLFGRGHARTRHAIAVPDRGIRRAEAVLGSKRLLGETRVDLVVRLVRPPGIDPGAGPDSRCRFVSVSIPCREVRADVAPPQMAERVGDLVFAMRAGRPGHEGQGAGAGLTDPAGGMPEREEGVR